MPKAPRTGVSGRSKQIPKDPRIPKGADYKRSIYYDPILNPYGAPPPGMPYKERSPTPDPYAVDTKKPRVHQNQVDGPKPKPSSNDVASGPEHTDEHVSDDDEDDDIVMPSGPPPPHARIAAIMPIVQPRITAPRPQPQSAEAITYEQPATPASDTPTLPKDSESSVTIAQPALGGSRSKLDATRIHPVSSPSPTPNTHAMSFDGSKEQPIPYLVEDEHDMMLNTPPAARIFFGTPSTAERQVVQRLDANCSTGTVYERPTPPLPTTPESSPGVGRVACPSMDLVEHRSILRDALGDVSNTSCTRFSPRFADNAQEKCTKPSYTPMRSSSARPPESLTPVQSVLQDWASSTFASSRTSPMKPTPRKESPIRLQRQNPSSGFDVFSSPSASPANQPHTHLNVSSSATPPTRPTCTASTVNAPSTRRVPAVSENRIHAQRVPSFSRDVPSPFARPSKTSVVPATRVPAQRSTANIASGTGQCKLAPEKSSRPQRLTRYASHVPATRVWDSPEKSAQKRARTAESSQQNTTEEIQQNKQAVKNHPQLFKKDLHNNHENQAQKNSNPLLTPLQSSSFPSTSQKGDALPVHSISPSNPSVGNSLSYPQAPSRPSEGTRDFHQSANETIKIPEQQDARIPFPCKTRDAVETVKSFNHNNEPKDASQAALSAKSCSESTTSARNSSTSTLGSTHTGSVRNLRTSTRISRKPTPAPLPMSAAELAKITAKHTKQNEQYSIDLRTQEFHLAGPRPPSPSQAFHVDARPREPHWQRVHHVETNDRGEPVRHARGAGDTEEYTTPPHQGRSIHWDKRLVVSPSLKPARRRPGSQHTCLVPARTRLDSFGNVPSGRAPNSRRQSVVIKRVVYENDDIVDSDDDDYL
ncbi:hypothetical protein MPSI1_001565 [Malassezia psittaci]|uniref:Uncharacterized protein n=1 Tax=Malassezia psittaci TaxID=1821823 RepID=A0AAF0JE03_9BASI|nr:hypothetical protein MPSI1_001565 [Malassezia psittaci]